MIQTGAITDADMIFFYLSMLDYLKPRRVLDIGMFLKRAGFISRQAMAQEISEEIVLYGIDVFLEYPLEIYETIYHSVTDRETFFREIETDIFVPEKRFDAAVLLGMDGILSEEEEGRLFPRLLRLSRGVMAEVETAERLIRMGAAGGYQPVSTGVKNFAWIPAME